MNILFLAPRVPLPADTGGKIRTLNILKQTAAFAKVTLLAFSFEAQDEQYAAELQKLGIAVHLVPMRENSFLETVCGVIFHPMPFSMLKYLSLPMQALVRKTIAEGKFDAVHIDHLHMAHYIIQCNGLPCFLDEHNVEYKILERCIPVERSILKKLVFWDQAIKMKSFERRYLSLARACFACSSDDKAILDGLAEGKVPVHVIPNGVDTGFFDHRPDATVKENNSLVFTGSMDWLPNNDGITYFCAEILPLLWAGNPAVKLYVVGKNPSATVQKLAQTDKRVIVTGRVDDVRPYIERSTVFIVPLRIGGGTRLKILEAMAMRKAVVSTSIGAEGIACQEGKDIAIADAPKDFARKVLDLMADPARVKSMEDQGRALVCAQYDWNVVGRTLKAVYQKACHGKNT